VQVFFPLLKRLPSALFPFRPDRPACAPPIPFPRVPSGRITLPLSRAFSRPPFPFFFYRVFPEHHSTPLICVDLETFILRSVYVRIIPFPPPLLLFRVFLPLSLYSFFFFVCARFSIFLFVDTRESSLNETFSSIFCRSNFREIGLSQFQLEDHQPCKLMSFVLSLIVISF